MNQPRSSLTLGGPWRFIPDPIRNGLSQGFWRTDADDSAWLETAVPASFETACPALEFYEGVCWYRHRFTVPAAWHGRRLVLTFGSVNDKARVWLNGEMLGTNEDPFLPFSFEIDAAKVSGATQALAVEVDNSDQPGDVPGRHVGWRRQGGIMREVTLTATDRRHIAQARINAEADGSLRMAVRIGGCAPESESLSLMAKILDPEGRVCGHLEAGAVGADLVELSTTVPGVRRWSDREPTLYRVQIDLLDKQHMVDQLTIRCGFRSIAATADGLLLNGEPIFLTGFNRHEDSPKTGMAADHPLARQDLEAMQRAGSNMVRFCHYPHHPQTLDWCDELGLLVFAEIPLYHWGNGVEHGRQHQSVRVKAARRQLERMIDRDWNHPSIVFWSVSNETYEGEPAVWKDNTELIACARNMDPSRLCVHVSNWWRSDPHFETDDVICLNYYPGMRLTRRTAIATADLREVTDDWQHQLQKLRQSHPDKPILITEFGYPSFAGTKGHAYGEDVQAKVLAAEFAAFDLPYICGATVWCWADHNWRRLSPLGVVISPFGVVTRDRQSLPALAVISKCFANRQRQEIERRRSPDDGGNANSR